MFVVLKVLSEFCFKQIDRNTSASILIYLGQSISSSNIQKTSKLITVYNVDILC